MHRLLRRANTVGPVAESVADPLPVEIAVDGIDPGGTFSSSICRCATGTSPFTCPIPAISSMGLDDSSPAVANAIQYAYDYAAHAPTAADCGGVLPATLPVVIAFHGWGGNSYGPHGTT